MSPKFVIIIVVIVIAYMIIIGIRMESRIKQSNELKQKQEEKTQEIETLQAEIKRLKELLGDEDNQLAEQPITEERKKFEEIKQSQQSKIQELNSTIARLEREKQSLKDEIQTLTTEIQKLRNKDYKENLFANPFASTSNLFIDQLVKDQEYVYRKKSSFDRPATKEEILKLSKEYLERIEYYDKNMSFKRIGCFTYTCGTQKNTLCEYLHVGSGTEFVLLPQGTLNNIEVEAMLMAKYECKQKEWFRIMKTRPWKSKNSEPFKDHIKNEEEYPAIFITLDDMKSYASKKDFKLPNNIQWEYACRAGSTTKYCYGDDEHSLDDYAWFKANSWEKNEQYAHKVGQKKPNAFGLYDMHGNVSEWCEDSNGYYTSRGGSISYSERECASNNDGGSVFSTATYNRGGRLIFQ